MKRLILNYNSDLQDSNSDQIKTKDFPRFSAEI